MSKISTYPSADTPLLLSDRLIGTEGIKPTPSPNPLATKNFSLSELLQLFSSNFPIASLQSVLDSGNTATQNIILTGYIDATLIKTYNIEDASGSQGTTFQYLSKGVSSINWVDLPSYNLQQVLDLGNTATQDVILIGNITTTKIIPGNIQDDTLGIGVVGQVLSKSTSGIRWITNPSSSTPGLADVLSVGNTATNDITLIGNIIVTKAIPENIQDETLGIGAIGQVLSKSSTGIIWADSSSATTSNVVSDVIAGAINVGDTVNANTNLQKFVEQILYKTYYPTLISPTFSLSNNAGIREIGSSSSLTLTFNFNRGNILGKTVSGIWEPTTTQGYRAGASTSYTINGTTQVGNTLIVSPILLQVGNPYNATVAYGMGIQPLDSKGGNFDSPFPAGTSALQSTTIQGIYPYFWYKSSSPITDVIMQSAIASGAANKVIDISTGTITIPFAANGEYIAVAYPSTSTTKTLWYVTALDQQAIPGGTLGAFTTKSCTTSLWSSINYKIHVSPAPITMTAPNTSAQLRNS